MRMHKATSNQVSGGNHADHRALYLSPRDLDIFRLLDPEYGYRYLPSSWIHAFVGGDPLRLAKRLGRLARAPNGYLTRHKDWYKHAVFERTAKADAQLGERRTRNRDPFAHHLLEDIVQASIALGVAADPALRLVSWQQLAATGKVPATTLDAKRPHDIPLRNGRLVPDGKPFAITRHGRWLFVLGKEIDRGTEPLIANYARRSIKEKLQHYHECFEDQRYTSHYGFPNSVVLFVTTSPVRMASMMELARTVIGPCSYLLFAHTKDWANERRFPSPNGDLLGPYQRVGHPPFNLSTLGE
jgi:hypothetical protein